MSKRTPSLPQRPRGFWPTPRPAVVPLIPYLPPRARYGEPCAGAGDLIDHLSELWPGGRCVWASHSCGNERCINPGHLYWATPKRNNADKILHGTTNRGERHGNSKLSDSGVLKIRSDSRSHSVIARDFGVDRSTISQIKRRVSWRHI